MLVQMVVSMWWRLCLQPMLTSMPKILLVGYVYMCPSYVGVCLFVCLFVLSFLIKDFLFFIFYIFTFYLLKKKRDLSNFLFSVFLFVLFLMMANDFFS